MEFRNEKAVRTQGRNRDFWEFGLRNPRIPAQWKEALVYRETVSSLGDCITNLWHSQFQICSALCLFVNLIECVYFLKTYTWKKMIKIYYKDLLMMYMRTFSYFLRKCLKTLAAISKHQSNFDCINSTQQTFMIY